MTGANRKNTKPLWTEDRVRRELEELLEGATEWPSYREFRRAGQESLRNQLPRFGGARQWAKRLGVQYPERKPGYARRWTEERVRADLVEFLYERESWPSRVEFEEAGRKPLRDAIGRLGGPERWAAEFGLPLRNLKAGSKLVWTDERIEAELRLVLEGRETWPGARELEQVGSYGLAGAVAHGRGTAYWARRLGFKPPSRAGVPKPRIWTDERIRAELERFCQGRTTWPTEREFREAGESALYSAACHHGGAPHWAAELGLVRTRRYGPAPGSRRARAG
jgi:hypothetical protein